MPLTLQPHHPSFKPRKLRFEQLAELVFERAKLELLESLEPNSFDTSRKPTALEATSEATSDVPRSESVGKSWRVENVRKKLNNLKLLVLDAPTPEQLTDLGTVPYCQIARTSLHSFALYIYRHPITTKFKSASEQELLLANSILEALKVFVGPQYRSKCNT